MTSEPKDGLRDAPVQMLRVQVWDTHRNLWFRTRNGNWHWSNIASAKGACTNLNRWMRENHIKKFNDQDRYVIIEYVYRLSDVNVHKDKKL